MPTVTPSKLFMIAMVIALGTAGASLISADKFPSSKSWTSYRSSTDATQTNLPRQMPPGILRREFVERMPFPYRGAGGALHSNRNLEYED